MAFLYHSLLITPVVLLPVLLNDGAARGSAATYCSFCVWGPLPLMLLMLMPVPLNAAAARGSAAKLWH